MTTATDTTIVTMGDCDLHCKPMIASPGGPCRIIPTPADYLKADSHIQAGHVVVQYPHGGGCEAVDRRRLKPLTVADVRRYYSHSDRKTQDAALASLVAAV
jgi:hypothetical protein